ncbi:hypothetical protein FRC10_005336 [Ceratobasidium sp. 414]|nr:hypothetical protein FRC10_005336 [Ceratobasidium sp. 414]
MKSALGTAVLASSVASVLAVAEWGQCGGIGYTGSTVCDSGLTCVVLNPYYSQCLTPTTTSTGTTSTSTTTSKPVTTTTTTTSSSAAPASTGFVKTSGQKFTLNGSTYTVVGSNAYWMAQLSTTADITTAYNDLKNSGLTTLRTWGFNDVTSASGTYYQLWSGSTGTLNTGADGLGRFDVVVSSAKALCWHSPHRRFDEQLVWQVLLPFAQNDSNSIIIDYGGMDVYVKQILGSSNHDLFYTDATVKAAFKKYINGFVSRYKNEPTILGWELANEPRCKGSTGTWTGTCNTTTITNWAAEMSAYIKSIDSNHLVGLGDEGFYNQPYSSDTHAANGPNYPYQGGEGVDFDANLSESYILSRHANQSPQTKLGLHFFRTPELSTLDFGTFHAYPGSWGQSANATLWGVQWIKDHATSQKAANKVRSINFAERSGWLNSCFVVIQPVIIEEFGVTSDQVNTYAQWYSAVISSGLTGDLIWQAGSTVSTGKTWDDGYAVFPGTDTYTAQTQHAAALKARG